MQLFSGSGGNSGSSSYNSSSTQSTNYPSWYEDFAKKLVGKASGLVDQPYPTYDVSNVFAPFQPNQTQAFNQVQGAQNQWQPFFNTAQSIANQGFGGAQGFFNQAANQPTALQAGSPFANAAATTWNTPGVAQSYMNPFIGGSVDYANQLTSQNFLRNILPGLTSQYVSGGGGGEGSRGALGSPQYQNTMDWALTNLNNTIAGNTQNALSQGYFGSAGLFNNDQARLAGLSGTVGNQAATSAGTLGNLGTAFGGLGNSTAGTFGNLGSAWTNNNLQNTNALLQVGNQQQQQAQNPLTYNYQQFLNQANWPYQTTSWGAGIESGLRVPSTTTTNSQGTQNTYGSSNSSASPFGTLLGIGASLGSMGGAGGIGGLASTIGGWLGGGGEAFGPLAGNGIMIPTRKRGGYFDGTLEERKEKKYAGGGPVSGILSLLGGKDDATLNAIGGIGDLLAKFAPMFLSEGGQPQKYAAGGLATVVRAGREDTRNDIKAAEDRRRNPLQGQRVERAPLPMRGKGFFAPGRRVASSPASTPGFFRNV
jgi:hypothetical protein